MTTHDPPPEVIVFPGRMSFRMGLVRTLPNKSALLRSCQAGHVAHSGSKIVVTQVGPQVKEQTPQRSCTESAAVAVALAPPLRPWLDAAIRKPTDADRT